MTPDCGSYHSGCTTMIVQMILFAAPARPISTSISLNHPSSLTTLPNPLSPRVQVPGNPDPVGSNLSNLLNRTLIFQALCPSAPNVPRHLTTVRHFGSHATAP